MKKFLKENWFVAVIAVLFVAGTIWFVYDQHKDDLPGKTVGGKDVVWSIGEDDVTADDLYNGLYKSYGETMIAQKFTDAVVDTVIPTTDELTAEAQSYVEYYSSYYSSYGGLSYLNQIAKQYGYDSFLTYMTYSIKTREMSSKYIADHADQYLTADFISKYNPRTVSYVLIKFEDPANPTAEESARLKAAQDAWASDQYTADNFADFAKAYSEDSSTASTGGVFGYIDNNTSSIDASFKEAALALSSGAVSEWTYSENFGWFLIKCDSTDINELVKDASLVSTVLTEYENASNEILWAYAKENNVQFTDETVKAYILSELGITESEGE